MPVLRLMAGLVASVLLIGDAQASKCVAMTVGRQFERADAVVTGLVQSVRPFDTSAHVIEAQVIIERSLKGTLTGQVSVLTEGTSAVSFEPGQRYLIYLESVSGENYATDRCSGTTLLDGAPVESTQDPKMGN